MRILSVITDPDRRGAQVFAHDLGHALTERGHTIETVALGRGSGAENRLDVDVLGKGVRDLRTLRSLRRRMGAVEIAIAHGASTGPACAIAGGRDRPFVYRQISDSRFWAPTRTRRLRVRLALSRARRIVALSEFNRAQLVEWIGVPDRKIRVVPNGVPPAEFSPADEAARRRARAELGLEDRGTVLAVAALVPEKGIDLAIECAGQLPDARLVVVGDGPDRNSLESLAATRAPGRVRFLGSLRDVVPAYHAADVVVFPSRGGDAMPAALIEAGLCGLPAVATGVGAVPEVVVDGVTGIVVGGPESGPITEALRMLLADPTRRHALGHAARARCLATYSIEVVAGEWEQVLRESTGAA